MSVTPTWSLEMKFDGSTWTDVSDDVRINDLIRGESGMGDNKATDRVARTGRLTFSLDNSAGNSAGLAGYYSPGHNNARSGFATGIEVRFRVSYDGYTRTKFYGKIAKDGIEPDTGIYGQRRTKITVLDYMNQLSMHELSLPQYTTNKRIDEIMPLIIGGMPIAPEATSYDTGVETFTSVFDTVREKTSAMSEINKLALSEWGFVYITHDKDNDEILRVENQNTRSSQRITSIPDATVDAGYLLKEDGGYLLQENGDKIVLEQAEEASFFIDTAVNPKISYGKNLANFVTFTTYPRRIDTSATVIYSISNAITLGAGETRELVANFRDPNNEAVKVAAQGVVTPVASTDFHLGTSTAGTDDTLTANLGTPTFSFGANAGSYSFTNSGTVDGYLWLQTRGTAIYIYNPVEYLVQGTASQADHGLHTMDINMPYQDEPSQVEPIANWLILDTRDPRYEVDSYPFIANRDDEHMMAFVHLELGNRIHITETQTGYDRDTNIDNIQFEVHPGNIIKATYKTRFVSSLTGWQLENVGYSELGETTYLG